MLANAKILLRKHAPGLAYFIKTLMTGPPGVSRSPEETFSAIYSSGTWGNDGDEPYSGSGSDDAVSAPFVEVLRRVIVDKKVETVVDLGCGDYRVGGKLVDMAIDYTGIDVVPELVARNNEAFGSDRVRFLCRDMTRSQKMFRSAETVRSISRNSINFPRLPAR